MCLLYLCLLWKNSENKSKLIFCYGKQKNEVEKVQRVKARKPSNHSKTSKKMRKEFFSKIRLFKIKNVKRIHLFQKKKSKIKKNKLTSLIKGFNESLQFLNTFLIIKRKKKKGENFEETKITITNLFDMPDNLSNGEVQ